MIMALKSFVIFMIVLGLVEFLVASPTRRQYVAFTEATASDSPATDGTEFDDSDDFDLDGEEWYSQSPASLPENTQEYNDEDYSRGNIMMQFGNDDDDADDDDEAHEEPEAEAGDSSRKDSEFLFVPPKDTRLVLKDDDDDQSGPIKVRHTGRSSYPKISDGADNSLESTDEDKDENGHPFEFTIDEDDKDDDTADEDDDDHKDDDDNSVEAVSRHEKSDNEEDEDDSDMFDNPEEDAEQVIYGDHVFLY